MNIPVLNFNAGELSPHIDARSDIDKYRAGCRTLENMIPRIYGDAERRPGTKYIDTCNGVSRVIPFIYSSEIAYIVLLENEAMYFYYGGARVLDGSGNRLKVNTPYLSADLFEIQYKQSNDVMWLVHPDYPPMKLSRTSATSFELTEIVFENGPFQKRHDLEFDDDVTLAPSATSAAQATTGDDITDATGCTYAASTTADINHAASKAFDNKLTGSNVVWQSAYGSNTNQWVSCQWTAAKTIVQVRIQAGGYDPLWYPIRWSRRPQHVRIDGSNDGTNWTKIPCSAWFGMCESYNTDELLLQPGMNFNDWAQVTLNNATPYLYYRVFCHDNYGSQSVSITEIEMMEAAALSADTATLTASSAVFEATHVGALFSLTQERAVPIVKGSWNYSIGGAAGPVTDAIKVEGDFTVTTHGYWTGVVTLQRRADNTTWENYKPWRSAGDTNIQYTATESEPNIEYRLYATEFAYNTSPGSLNWPSLVYGEITVNSSTETGICRVTAYNSTTSVNVNILKDFASTNPTPRWAEGSFSDKAGYPCTMTFFENRCVYAGTSKQPQTVWLSGTDDFEDFQSSTLDDGSFSLTMSSDLRNGIQWVCALESLIVGTSGSEWRIRSTSFDEALTPTNYSFKQQTTYGSKALQALPVNDAVLFADQVGRKVREATYNGDKDKYVAPDLCALAEHITESGIASMAFQRNPDPILWCTLYDGSLISMTYEREQNVVAWAKHPFDVGFGVDGERTTTTTTKRYPTLQTLDVGYIPTWLSQVSGDGAWYEEITSQYLTATPPAQTALSGAISVTDVAGLAAMLPGNHYSIDADINMAGVTWTPLDFNSAAPIVIEGNNHTISNLSMGSATAVNVGLIGVIDGTGGGQIRNLRFSNCSAAGDRNIAILVGLMQPDASDWLIQGVTFNSCTVTQDNTSPGVGGSYGAGVLCGTLYGLQSWVVGCTATDCTVTTATHNDTVYDVGGLIGRVDETTTDHTTATRIIDCHTVGGTLALKSEEPQQCGGLLGYTLAGNHGTGPLKVRVYDCSSSMEIVYTAPLTGAAFTCNSIGGFVGRADETYFYGCSATGALTFTSCGTWNGAATPPDDYLNIGGFIGRGGSGSCYVDCSATGTLTFADGSDQPEIDYVGGFSGGSGYSYENLLHCYSTGDIVIATKVSDLQGIGGFMGYMSSGYSPSGVVEQCWSTGDITITGDITAGKSVAGATATCGKGQIAGFIGFLASGTPYNVDLLNCYCWGSVLLTGTIPVDLRVAGFVGAWSHDQAESSITNCYCAQTNTAFGSGLTSQITITADTYAFAGGSEAANVEIEYCFFDTETSGILTDDNGAGHLTDWMQTQSNYEAAGWDFSTIWTMPVTTTVTSYTASGLGPNSVAVIPGTDEDEVWLVVARYINGSTVRYVEQMQPRSVTDLEDMWFVDSGVEYTTAASTFSGLDHLEACTVAMLGDGNVYPRQVVSSGQITQTGTPTHSIIGLPFRYTLKPMRFDLTSGSDTTKGSLKNFPEVVLSFYRTLNAEYGTDVSVLFKIDWRTDEPYGSPTALYTGDKVVTHEGGFDVEDEFILTGDDPLPCTLRAIVPRTQVTGR